MSYAMGKEKSCGVVKTKQYNVCVGQSAAQRERILMTFYSPREWNEKLRVGIAFYDFQNFPDKILMRQFRTVFLH